MESLWMMSPILNDIIALSITRQFIFYHYKLKIENSLKKQEASPNHKQQAPHNHKIIDLWNHYIIGAKLHWLYEGTPL